MQEQDFPSFYQAADKASIKAQRFYVNFLRVDLVSMVTAALLTIYNFENQSPKLTIYIISGLLLLISTILTLTIKNQQYEDTWYQGRALAESIKTITWRYITCSENFESSLPQASADTNFINTIHELNKEFSTLSSRLDAKLLSLPIISLEAKRIRSLNWQERKDLYIKNRIQNQKGWYSTKAEFNAARKDLWFWIVIIAQILSILASALLIFLPNSTWNLVGLFTTISAAGLAWLELKQHHVLKEAYTTAAVELNKIESLSFNVVSESDLVKYVLDSENAISREHTLWVAQRRK